MKATRRLRFRKAVNSAVFNMDRMHADTHKMVVDSMSVEAADMIRYCNADELNIRPDGAGNGDPVGLFHKGDQVHVTGVVKSNGVATGWVRVDYNGTSGYVSDAFLVSEKTEKKQDDPAKPSKTGNKKEIYYINSNSVIIYEYSDGKWKDDNGIEYWTIVDSQWVSSDGKLYWSIGDGQWRTNQGETLYDDPNWIVNHRQDSSSQDDSQSNTGINIICDATGETAIVYDGGDGYFYTTEGRQFWRNEAHIYMPTDDQYSDWYAY